MIVTNPHIFALAAAVALVLGCAPDVNSTLRDQSSTGIKLAVIGDGTRPEGGVDFTLHASTSASYQKMVLCYTPPDAKDCSRGELPMTAKPATGERRFFSYDGKIPLRSKYRITLRASGPAGRSTVRSVRLVIPTDEQGTTPDATGTESTTKASGEMQTPGRKGDFEESFAAKNGLSSKFKINVPQSNGDTAHGMLVYLHGDGAGDYSWFWSDLKKAAAAHNLIAVSILTPASSRRWYADGDKHATYVDELVRGKLYREYNVNKDNVIFTGASGGPQFLSGQFFPLKGNHYTGGALLMCGGGGPTGFNRWFRNFKPSETFREKFQMLYYTGTADFLHQQVVNSVSFYKQFVNEVESEYPSGVAHCKFQMGQVLTTELPRVLE